MPIAYSYTRFSTMGQKRGASEARQGEAALPWCLANGYTLDTSLKPDEGKSGYKGSHLKKGAALGKFLDLIEAKAIEPGSVLLIENIDRLSRLPWQEGLDLVRSILDAGVSIATIMDNQIYTRERLSKDMGCIFLLMMNLCTANEQSDTKSHRGKDVWERRRKSALKVGTRPAWIKEDRSVDKEKADIIRRIFQLAIEGKGSKAITRILNGEGVPTLSHAKQWSTGIIDHYLKSRTVLGELQYRKEGVPTGEPVVGFYTPIVDATTFALAARQFHDRKRHGVRGRVSEVPNLFVGLIRNLYDDSTYIFKTSTKTVKGKVYSQKRLVPYKSNMGVAGSMNIQLNYNEFQSSFFRFVREIDVPSLFTPRDKTKKSDRLRQVQDSLIEIEERLRLAKEQFKTAKNKAIFLSLLDEAESERQAALSEVETLRSELTTSEIVIFTDLLKVLDDPNARPKIASTLRMLIDSIDVLPVHTGVGQCARPQYLLFVRVRFHNQSERWYITDHTGTDRIEISTIEDPETRVDFSKYLDDAHRYDLKLFKAIYACILKASDLWKDRLLDWVSMFYEPRSVSKIETS